MAGKVQAGDQAGPVQDYSFGRRELFLLMIIYMVNHVDRQIMNILAEPIKLDLHLSDKEMGLLTGLSFALFYTILQIPLARVAEYKHRPSLIGASLVVWSGFTAVCGLAHSFVGLFLARMGVGIGEAGCFPAAQSLIAEYAPPAKRVSSVSMFLCGAPLGVLAGMAMGGLVSDAYGWRTSFLLAGLPGIPLALLLLLIVKDPARSSHRVAQYTPPFLEMFRELLRNPTYWLLNIGILSAAVVAYSQGAFIASFFLRVHGEALDSISGMLGPTGSIGILLGLILGCGGALGTLGGGTLVEKIAKGDGRICIGLAALACFVAAPLCVSVFLMPTFWGAILILFPAITIGMVWQGPAYATIAMLAGERSRATAIAISLLLTTVVGLGLGPLMIGTISDFLTPTLGSGNALRSALLVNGVMYLISGLAFLATRRSMRRQASIATSG